MAEQETHEGLRRAVQNVLQVKPDLLVDEARYDKGIPVVLRNLKQAWGDFQASKPAFGITSKQAQDSYDTLLELVESAWVDATIENFSTQSLFSQGYITACVDLNPNYSDDLFNDFLVLSVQAFEKYGHPVGSKLPQEAFFTGYLLALLESAIQGAA